MFEFAPKKGVNRKKLLIRVFVAMLLVLSCFGLLIYRLYFLQIVRYQGFSERAERNRITLLPIPPKRGDVVDRNGEVLARSYRDYTIEIVPHDFKDLDALINELQEIIAISPLDIKRFKQRVAGSNRYTSIPLRRNITDKEAALFAANSYKFPKVSLKARWVREYPQGETAAHLIGYVGRISEKDQEKLEEEGIEGNYRGTDLIGKKGIELSYETQLHGKTGWQEVEISASGKPVRILRSTDPEPGLNLRLSVDLGLQKLAESLFVKNGVVERGALVAIDPRSGQVLAYVSSPSYDPNLFVDGIDVDDWRRLADDENSPLLNRPISGTFPVGSTYKPFVGLAAMQLGVRAPEKRVYDPGYFEYGRQRFRNAGGAVYGNIDMHRAIVVSSDTFFFSLGPEIGVDRLHDFTIQFGFGKQTGIDLVGEKRGILPSKEWKSKAFKDPKKKSWLVGETISVAVGQGYNSFTIMQLAQATSVLAANGVYMRPHLVNLLENPLDGSVTPIVKEPEYIIPLNQKYIDVVKNAMLQVTRSGTARRVFAGADYLSAGKTGTAQVFNLRGSRYNARNLKKRLHDHALYIGYAPADNPKIALALIVENGGWGSTVAAPIARKVFDYWLSPQRQKVYEESLINDGYDTTISPAIEDNIDAESESSPDTEVPEKPLSNPEDKPLDTRPEIFRGTNSSQYPDE